MAQLRSPEGGAALYFVGYESCPWPNPSIERTRPDKPGRAAHVER